MVQKIRHNILTFLAVSLSAVSAAASNKLKERMTSVIRYRRGALSARRRTQLVIPGRVLPPDLFSVSITLGSAEKFCPLSRSNRALHPLTINHFD